MICERLVDKKADEMILYNGNFMRQKAALNKEYLKEKR